MLNLPTIKTELSMAEFPYFRSSVARKVEAETPGDLTMPGSRSNQDLGEYRAYNQARRRFLCANVEATDSSATSLDARLPDLTPGSGRGLWIVPIQNISATSVGAPLDLIYLDRNCVVLDAVESFPISQATAAIGSATSVLALPAQTIGSTGTERGDQLFVCVAEEMKLRLQQASDPNAETRSGQSSSQNGAETSDRLNQRAVGNVLPWVDRSNPKASSEIAPALPEVAPPVAAPSAAALPVAAPAVSAPPAAPDPPQPVAASPAPSNPEQAPAPRWKAKASGSWLQRLLAPEPADPRNAPRTALPWLVAYFFTGARPIAHGIRDISATGVFVFTDERWYPGTVVRMTLTDQRNPTKDQSFTINAEVMRSADDGVGFQFVLKDGRASRHASASGVDCQAQGVFRAELDAFLLRMSQGAE